MPPLPLFSALLPIAVAALIMALSAVMPRRAADALALGTALVSAVLCLSALPAVLEAPVVYWFGGWLPRDGAAIGICFYLDAFGVGAAATVSIIASASLLFSWRYFDSVGVLFHTLVLVFVGAMVTFCLSGDLFTMFVFFELMSITGYALTAYKIEKSPLEGAVNFAVTNSIGAFFILTGITLLYGRTGALNLAQIGAALAGTVPDGLVIAAFVFIMTGFLTKAAIVPFHFWLADAHAVAPTPICVLFSGIMVELGIYAAARVYWTVFSGSLTPDESSLRFLFLFLSSVTILIGGVMCLVQRHLKRLLAFSSVSHMGILLGGLGIVTHEGLAGTGLYLLSHSLLKGALFVCAGTFLNALLSVDESELRGKGRPMPFTCGLFAVGGLALAGMPPFGLSTGKAVMDAAAAGQGLSWLSWVFAAGSAMTGAAVLRAAAVIFFGLGMPDMDRESPTEKEKPETGEGQGRAPWVLILPAVLLIGMTAAVGIAPDLDRSMVSAASLFQDRQGITEAVLDGKDLLAFPADTAEKETWKGYVSAAGAIALAALMLSAHRMPRSVRRFIRLETKSIGLLRALHCGHPGDYTIWMVIGSAVIAVILTAGVASR